MKKIMVVGSDPSVRRLLSSALKEWSYVPLETTDINAAIQIFDAEQPSLILIDADFPDGSGLNVPQTIGRSLPNAFIVAFSADDSAEHKIAWLRAGARFFIAKPINLEEIQIIIEIGIEGGKPHSSVQGTPNYLGFDQIIGESPKMKEVISLARKVAESNIACVLLQGESGTGKDMIAKAIHYASSRADKPFVAINCAAIPANLIESELFGYEKGAFTDAKHRKEGLFEQAAGGTIFLDEIGDLDISLQAKLLRVLEENSFRRVGGIKDIPLNARIIAASNKDLKAESERKSFRLDLYYRLSIIQIDVPPLREREDDMLLMAAHFIKTLDRRRYKAKNRKLAPEVVKVFRHYKWLGNVRELRNAIERALILEDGEQITLKYLPLGLNHQNSAAAGDSPRPESAYPVVLPPDGISLEVVEDSLITQALNRSGGNVTRAAELLFITRDQMRYYLKKKKLQQSNSFLGRSNSTKNIEIF